MTQLLLDFPESTRRKASGQARALAAAPSAWEKEVRRVVGTMRGEFRMEVVRELVEKAGFFPKKNNAWGAITGLLSRERVIVWTGRYENNGAPKTKAHPSKVWRLA